MTSTLSPGRLLGEGKYELLSPLGQGAMGAVWLARHVALDRMVAVKLLHSGLQLGRALASTQARRDNASERFLKEARTASLLRHKNTVQLLDYGADAVDRWLVMEFLEGKTLADELHDAGRFAAPRAIAIVTQVLASLAEAHDFGIVHRDLKPLNIMLVPWVDDDGHETELAKVLDFGIATMMSDEVADRNEVAGTPEYMSPEQAQAFDVDPRSDIYAAGTLLYHLLTGATPFSGQSPMATMLSQVNDEPAPPRSIEPSISVALEALILASLAKDPDGRPESARALRSALLALPEARGLRPDSSPRLEPVVQAAVATSPATRSAARVSRSRRWLWASLGLVALTAVAAFVLVRSDEGGSSEVLAVAAPTPELAPTPEPTPTPTPELAPTPEPTPTPTPELAPTPEPIPTPEPPPEPTPIPEPTPTPTPELAPTPEPTPTQQAAVRPPRPRPTTDTPDAPRVEDPPKVEVAKLAAVTPEPAKPEPTKLAAVTPEPAKPEPAKPEPDAPAKPHAPSLSASAAITSLAIRGSLPRSAVARALDAARGPIEACYASAARAAGRDHAGVLGAIVVYDTDGKVSNVTVSVFPLAGVGECVNQALWRTRLRERPDTGSVDASFRIAFTPR